MNETKKTNYIEESIARIALKDPAVAEAIAAEYQRESDGIELIASENFVSEESC